MNNINNILDELLRNSSATVAIKIKALNEICQEQVDRGSRDFSIATIGRIAESRGLLKTQSIRNDSGHKYRDIIDAWAKFFTKTGVKENTPDWVESIPDHQVRWMVRDMATELTKLRGEINLLKSIDRHIYINQVADKEHDPHRTENSIIDLLGEPDFEALQKGISESNLSSLGLYKGTLGEIKNATGVNVMPHGFIRAIEKIISLNNE